MGSTITACFYDGTGEARQSVVEVANEWTKLDNVNISIDFGNGPNFRSCSRQRGRNGRYEDIRITFKRTQQPGYWSYVGLDSHLSHLGDTPSMSLDGFDQPIEAGGGKRYLVLHEFGHALGFEHEHQSPGAGCEEEFDLEAIKQKLKWPDDLMKRAFKTLETNSRKFEWSVFESESIMMYSLPTDYFKKDVLNPRCKVPQNTTLSNGDVRALQRAYPKVVSKTQGERTRSLEADQVLALEELPKSMQERANLSKSFEQ